MVGSIEDREIMGARREGKKKKRRETGIGIRMVMGGKIKERKRVGRWKEGKDV